MNTFKRKALTCAVLAGLGAVATSAEAVYRNPDGTGQVLIFPYYTVNSSGGNAYNTYVSITNTTSRAKVLKVRFREGRASAEVLDFNLYLSPNDVWVGAVGPQGTAADAPAAIFSNPLELSCTSPLIPAGGEPFKNFDYLPGTGRDLPGTGLDRTREGYIEVFDMASLGGQFAINVTHTAINTPPPNCSAMRADLSLIDTVPSSLSASTGGLYGEGTIINVINGGSMTYKADALASYNNQAGGYYSDVTRVTPVLGLSAVPPNSLVLANNNAYFDTWAAAPIGPAPAGARAVAAVFMHSSVMNDYILDTNTASNTDWVVTFPGKNEFVTTVTASAPYTAVLTTAGACESVQFTFFNRDEQSFIPATGGFSPQPTGVGGPGQGNLCWESTVVSIRNGQAWTTANDVSSTALRSGVLGSRNVTAVTVLGSFEAGWIDMSFQGTNALAGILSGGGTTFFGATGTTLATAHTFIGLPVTGFMVTARSNRAVACTVNGTAGNCQGNYTGLWNHSYRTTIRP